VCWVQKSFSKAIREKRSDVGIAVRLAEVSAETIESQCARISYPLPTWLNCGSKPFAPTVRVKISATGGAQRKNSAAPPRGHPTYVTPRPKKSTHASAISKRYSDIVVYSSRNIAMMASGSMNLDLTCRDRIIPLLDQSAHWLLHCTYPLLGLKRTSQRCLICRSQGLHTRCPAFAFVGEHRQENDRNSQCE